MDDLDPFPDLDGAWDARPAPLSRELRTAFVYSRRLRRARWLGAILALGFIATHLATWPWRSASGYTVSHRWLLLAMSSAVLSLSLLPGFRWNRWALCLGVPFMDYCSYSVHYSTGCCAGTYLPYANPWLYSTLFGGAAAYLLLRRLIAGCVDRRVAWCFLHWHRACTPPEHFADAPKFRPPPLAHWLTWPLTALTLALAFPPLATFAADYARRSAYFYFGW